jgi:NAD(P)-dependent dehydrogenase (short-subunit alcohol dehydrogenase family)
VPGRTIVITGASDGIGAAAARRLCQSGEKVVAAGRSKSKTAAVAGELGADYFVADFADLPQVRNLAHELRSRYARIDVLANNAGAMTSTLHMTDDGYDTTYQVNYLAPFLLTTLLSDVLVDSHAAVVNTSSMTQKSCAAVSTSRTLRTHPPPPTSQCLRSRKASNRLVHHRITSALPRCWAFN